MSILWFSNDSLCIPLEQVLHMDRNDHYGGASSSLNLMQVILDMRIHSPSSFFLQRNTSILMSSDLFILFFGFSFQNFIFLLYSFGSVSREMTSLKNNWGQAESTMLIWYLRYLEFYATFYYQCDILML